MMMEFLMSVKLVTKNHAYFFVLLFTIDTMQYCILLLLIRKTMMLIDDANDDDD